MYINGKALIEEQPIRDMLTSKESNGKVSHGLTELGYDITLAERIMFVPACWWKLRFSSRIIIWDKYHNRKVIKGRFCLASANEYFQMPKHLAAEVKDKSSWARRGMQLYNTVIEPGWHGYLTLEINFHGNQTIHITSGSGIAQVLFQETAEDAEYTGKYQFQEAGPQQARYA